MLRSLSILVILFILGNDVFADQTKQFEFSGGDPEVQLQVLNELFETKTRYETVDDTCYNSVPYVVNVCRNVTRYDTQCQTIPAYEECRDVYEDLCRPVTRYRQECHNGPSRRICEPGPDQQDCRPGPSQRQCRPGPSQQVCRPGPVQQVCRNAPDTQDCQPGPTRRECRPGPTREECETGPSQQVCRPGPSQRQCRPGTSRQVCEPGPSQRVCKPGQEEEVCVDVPKEECNVVNGRRICRRVVAKECRKVPGKEECRDVPGRQVCRQVPGEEVCTNVPGPEVCTTQPGRRICRQVPGPEVCSNVPGEPICRTVPGRRICENVQGPDICTTVPGQDICQNVPGPDICRTIPGQPICQDIPGPPVCRDVAYQDQECRQVARRVCEIIPPQQVCQQVPYEDRVCQDETQYRQEPYACTRQVAVNYREKVGEEVAELFFRFGDFTQGSKGKFAVTLKDGGEIQLKAEDASDESSLIILRSKEENRQNRGGRNLLVQGSYQIDFQAGNPLEPIKKGIKKLKLNGETLKFQLPKVEKWQLEDLKYSVFVTRVKDRLAFNSPVSFELLEIKQRKDSTEVQIPLNKLGLNLKWLRSYRVGVTIKPEISGEILNGEGPQGQLSAQEVKINW